MTIVIGCDNAAVDLKNTLADFLRKKGITVEDEGCTEATDPTVYPVIAKRVCENIINSGYTKRGILVCGTGIGMCMTAVFSLVMSLPNPVLWKNKSGLGQLTPLATKCWQKCWRK